MKVWIYLFILTGVMIFLSMAGLPSGTNDIKTLIGYNEGTNHTIQNVTITGSGFSNFLFGGQNQDLTGILVTIGLALGSIAVGLLTKTSTENLILLPFITTIGFKWVQTFTGILNYAVSLGDTIITPLIVLIFLPLTVGFIISLMEFFRGTD